MQSPLPQQSERRRNLPAKAFHEQDDSSTVIHKSIHAKCNLVSKVGRPDRDIDWVVLQRKPVSFHPPPMNRDTPNIYFDRSPEGSGIGAHSFDLLVGLPDHSDPRTFHTGNSRDQSYLLVALQPTIDHFREVTDGAEPREVSLCSGYEVAHVLLQAHLRSWFATNCPHYAHNNAIPRLFKLERWEGGIEHWRLASNCPMSSILLHPQCQYLALPASHGAGGWFCG